NIRGLFFMPHPGSQLRPMLDWDRFSTITFGHLLTRPILHSVNNDHYRSFALLMRKLTQLGYRRPGFAVWPLVHEATDRNWTAAFYTHQVCHPQEQVPVFMDHQWTMKAFHTWFDRYRPDVVISH